MSILQKVKGLLKADNERAAQHAPYDSGNPMPPEGQERAMQQQNPEGAKGQSGPL